MDKVLTLMFVVTTVIPVTLAISSVEEVDLGDTAVLKCPSNDDNHRFQFWQMEHNRMIGPTNPYDRNKYKYDVLTGNLTIRAVSSSEHGLYTCVSKHILDNSFSSETVELVVKRDWEEVYETDHLVFPRNEQTVYTDHISCCIPTPFTNPEDTALAVKYIGSSPFKHQDLLTNVFRVSLLAAVLLVLLVLVLILYNMTSDRTARFTALDEESPDEPGPSQQQGHIYQSSNRLAEFDTHILDTELPRPAIFTDVKLSDTVILE